MLELEDCKSTLRIPSLSVDVLDDYSRSLVGDYVKKLEPCNLSITELVADYLGLELVYCHFPNASRILGLTVFRDSYIETIHDTTGFPHLLKVYAGSIIIDTSLRDRKGSNQHDSTIAHEVAHWLLHRSAFEAGYLSDIARIYKNPFHAAREGSIGVEAALIEPADIELMEQQADYFSAALLESLVHYHVRQAASPEYKENK